LSTWFNKAGLFDLGAVSDGKLRNQAWDFTMNKLNGTVGTSNNDLHLTKPN
jgi:hypothetical protein